MKVSKVDYLVLGAGAVGTAAAYHLARRGASVTLVEQFELGHEMGSSHGPSRVIRHSYADPVYARLMKDAYESWRALEADAGEVVLTPTGGVSLCPPELDYVSTVTSSLEAVGVPHRRMTGQELRRSYPTFQVRDDEDVVFEPAIGVLAASRIVRLQAELAARHGGERFRLLERTAAERLKLDGPAVVVRGERIEARTLLVAAGAWTKRLLPSLAVDLRISRQCVAHFRAVDPAPYAVGRFPVFIRQPAPGPEAFYGLPGLAGADVKLGIHHNEDAADVERVDRTVSAADIERIRGAIRDLLPGLADAAVSAATICLYTVAPLENFVVGPLPDCPNVLVASACSGHGFKFANLVGRALAEMAMDGGTELDVSSWRVPAGPLA